MTRKGIVTALAGLLLVGCAEADAEPTADPAAEPSLESGTEPGVPPPVTVRFDGRSAELSPWTYCYGNACADGVAPENPVDVGRPAEVYVEFPVPDWTFTAIFQPAGDECGRQHDVPLEPVGDGVFLLRPAGYADTYDVTLAGWGDGEGDVYVTFRWTTPTDGPLPEPTARLAVLADHDGEVDSYGVELMVTQLARTPEQANAQITVTAGNGEAVTFEAERSVSDCDRPGTVYWDGPDDEGLRAARLGDGPFRYDVTLELDGVDHTATATWPDDEIEDNEPSVALRFTPDLPALG